MTNSNASYTSYTSPEPYESTLEDILAQYEEIYLPSADEIPLPSDEDAPPEKPLAAPYPPEAYPEDRGVHIPQEMIDDPQEVYPEVVQSPYPPEIYPEKQSVPQEAYPEKQNAVAKEIPKPQHDVPKTPAAPNMPEAIPDPPPDEPYKPISALWGLEIPDYVVSAANVRPAEHRFLLGDSRFPIGEIAIIAGAGGMGKGQLAAAHMAYTSRGYDLSGQEAGSGKRCLFISAEDTAEDVKRRIERSVFPADSRKIFIIGKTESYKHSLNLSDPENTRLLEGWINVTGASVVYIDPLQAFVGEFTDLSRQNHVRHVMHTLAALAEQTDCCIVLLMHLNKRQQIISAADLLCGSSDIVNASRSTMLLTNDFKDGNPDRRYLFHIKSNHARSAKTLEVNIGAAGNRIVGECEVTADEYVQAVNSRKTSKAAAGAPDYERMFYAGVEQMIAEGTMQMTFREFVERFAPTFNGRAKFIFDDITVKVEERLGYTIQTKTSDKTAVRVSQERGFRLVKL